MRSPLLLFPVALLLLASGCRQPPTSGPVQDEWRAVVEKKKALASAEGVAAEQRQHFADAVGAFLQRHPQHERARTVFDELQVELARELIDSGQLEAAIAHLENVLERDPAQPKALAEIERARSRQQLPAARFDELCQGMSAAEIEQLLGAPRPGWRTLTERRGETEEAWMYRTADGSVAAVFLREGKAFAAEHGELEKLPPCPPRRNRDADESVANLAQQ